MNSYQAAQHYAKVLRNVADAFAVNDADAETMQESITLYGADDLSDRYGDVPKVIWEHGSIELGAFELRTDYGWIDLYEYGLDEDAARHAEPYNRSVLCFYD